MIGYDCGPGAGAEPDHQHLARARMQAGERVGPDDAVPVAPERGVEASVVAASAVDRSIRGDGDDAALVLDYVRECFARPVAALELQLLVEGSIQGGRVHGESQADPGERRKLRGEPPAGTLPEERKQTRRRKADQRERKGDPPQRPEIEKPESRPQASGGGAENVREIHQSDPST